MKYSTLHPEDRRRLNDLLLPLIRRASDIKYPTFLSLQVTTVPRLKEQLNSFEREAMSVVLEIEKKIQASREINKEASLVVEGFVPQHPPVSLTQY